MKSIVRVALAECFTQGNVCREIHAHSMGYPLTYQWKRDSGRIPISVVAGLFIPTLSGIRTFLHFEPLIPAFVKNDIKIYDQEQDIQMALLMAQSVKTLSGADIGIGTTAGVGKGAVAVVYNGGSTVSTSDVYADLLSSPSWLIGERQRSGVKISLQIFESVINKLLNDSAS